MTPRIAVSSRRHTGRGASSAALWAPIGWKAGLPVCESDLVRRVVRAVITVLVAAVAALAAMAPSAQGQAPQTPAYGQSAPGPAHGAGDPAQERYQHQERHREKQPADAGGKEYRHGSSSPPAYGKGSSGGGGGGGRR